MATSDHGEPSMRGSRPIGLGGAGVAVLLFVLQQLDVEIPGPVLVGLGVVSGLAILYGVVAWLAADRGDSPAASGTSVTSIGSSGHTVQAGGNVTIGGPASPATASTVDLTVEVEELEPRQIPNWEDDWRVSVRVTNTSETAEVSAYLLAPIGGIAETDYGDFNLQWETTNKNFTTLVKGKPERLHIARIANKRRSVRFLSPGEYSGLPREHQHPPKKITDSPVRGKLRFSALKGGCKQRDLEVHLDHENYPTVHIGPAESC
jgi:hypothetical protein